MKRLILSITLSVLTASSMPISAFAASEPPLDVPYEDLNLTTSLAQPGGYDYVSLGDSVAAGIGLKGSYGNASCGKTTEAYNSYVADFVDSPLVSIACSGATAGDLVTQQYIDGPNPPAQIKAAFAKGTPKIMTITAGANDVQWSTFIKKCYIAGCGGTTDTVAITSLLWILQLKLHYSLSNIAKRSGGLPPKVYITGYYNPVSPACVNKQFTAPELAWVSSQAKSLSSVIKNVSKFYSFAEFVPIDFTGHDICSPSPWVQGAGAKAPFHPTATGQEAMANAIIAAMKN